MSTHVSLAIIFQFHFNCVVINSRCACYWTGYGFKMLLEKKCADILQPDITWCGGMTEARRIVALASAYDIPIIPHGSSIYSYHLQICFPSCPMAEFLVMSPKADSIGGFLMLCFLFIAVTFGSNIITYIIYTCMQSRSLETCLPTNHCPRMGTWSCQTNLALVSH